MRMIYTLLFSAAIAVGCGALPVAPSGPEDCEAACGNLAEMQCPGWDPECVEMCEAVNDEQGITMNTQCIIAADSCAAVELCFR